MSSARIGWRTDPRSSPQGPPDLPSGLALSLIVLFVVPVILALGYVRWLRSKLPT